MTRSALAFVIATVLVGSSALAQQPSTQPIAEQSALQNTVPNTLNDTTSGNTQADSSHQPKANRLDARFLKDFAQINAAVVETGKTAEYKADDAEVKAFATQMIDIHSKTIGKVKTMAVQTNVEVKAKPEFMQKVKSAFLDINVGGSFDRAYMTATVDDYEKVVEMLEREIKDGQDANIKQLASEALSDVQEHLKIAQDLRAKVFSNQNAHRTVPRNVSSGAEKIAAIR